MRARTYSISILLLIALSFLGIAGFNAVIDPYRFFNTPTIRGINEYKIHFLLHQFLAKPYTVEVKKPDGIILGSSRAGSSLVVEHPGWDGFNAYNFAIAGVDPYFLWRGFQHAKANGKLKRVLLTLDFYMFNVYYVPWSPEARQEYDERLSVTSSNRWNYRSALRWFKDMSVSLLSFDTLYDSWKTWRGQPAADDTKTRLNTLYESGFWVAHLGINMQQRQQFHAIEKQYMGGTWFPEPRHKFATSDSSNPSRLEYVQKLLAECYRDGIDVTIVFTPFHARLAEAMHAVGIWTLFEQWKKDVIGLNEQEAVKNGRPAFPVWDFTGYNSITTEVVPRLGDRGAEMQWHIDAMHISKAAGDLMQDKIWGRETTAAPDFGRKVTSSNIDSVIKESSEARTRYVEAFPADVQEITNMATRTRSQRISQ